MSESETVIKQYNRLVNDEDFDKLELGLKNPNIFQILRISKAEIRHSNFLSWLLSPNESHNLGDAFLKRFLREVFSYEKYEKINQLAVEELDLSKVVIYREWFNIDILIVLEKVVICIENKVLSKDHSNQLKKYKKTIKKHHFDKQKVFVYLNPFGEESSEESETYHPVSYIFIIDTLHKILSIYGESINKKVFTYIKDYITIVERELMGNDKTTKLAQKIYANHREIFDFVFDNKPDVYDDVRQIFLELLEERGYVLGSIDKYVWRFTTKQIDELTYRNKVEKSWKDGESFLFEFLANPKEDVIIVKTVLAPTDHGYERERLDSILRGIEKFKKPKGKKYLVHFSEKHTDLIENITASLEDEDIKKEIKGKLAGYLDKFEPIIKEVENKFLQHKKELLKMKNIL